MSAEQRDQPSKVSTEEEQRPADEHVVTSDLPDDVVAASSVDPDAKPAASLPGEQKPAATAAADDNEKPRRDRSAERRIGRLTKQIATLSSARATDRQQIETLTGKITDLQAASATATPEPQLVDFATPQEFAKAYGKWDAGQSTLTPKPGADQAAPATPARSPDAHATYEPPNPAAEIDPEVKSFQSRGQEKLGEEFIEALNIEGTAVDVDMGEFLMDSDYGPEIYIHLANNQDDAKKIYDSGATRKVDAMRALEAKAKAGELDIDGGGLNVAPRPDLGESDNKPKETPAASPAKPKPGSKETAAKPPPEDTGQPGSATVKMDPEDESMDDYAARRGKEEARRQGRIP